MKMIIIVIYVLAGCAVRCDDTRNEAISVSKRRYFRDASGGTVVLRGKFDVPTVSTNNYFVIEMPEQESPKELPQKPFQVFWNVPTMQCRSKKIPFENLFEKYGIIQNKNDDFRGDKIAILYDRDPGLFPALLRNESSGKLRFRNGGVPQEGDVQRHMDTFRNVLGLSIPDEKFDGVGIIDFESWRPIFRQNFGVLVPYKDVSYEIERKRHTYWLEDWIKSEAKSRFEEASRRFMQTTISIAKQMRPLARWGYYGFPYCFNGNPVTRDGRAMEKCANGVTEENDRTYWLWSESSALYPSVYSSVSLETYQLTAFIRGRVAEAQRVNKRGSEILPYFWFRYRDGGYLTERDLKASLQTFHKTGAAGFIIWGSSNDVNSVDKCNNLLSYLNTTLGPAIAKYTKKETKLDFEENYELNDTDVSTVKPEFSQATLNSNKETVRNCSKSLHLDPENCWELPANYSQDIKYNVDEHYNNSEINANTTGKSKIIPVNDEIKSNDKTDASATDNKLKTESPILNMMNKHKNVDTQETTTEFKEALSTIINSKHENELLTESDQNAENNNRNLDLSTTENNNQNFDPSSIQNNNQNIDLSTTENYNRIVDLSTTENSNSKEKEYVTSSEVLNNTIQEFTNIVTNENKSQTKDILLHKSTESTNSYHETLRHGGKNGEANEETTTDVTTISPTTSNSNDESTAYNENYEQTDTFHSTSENDNFKSTDDISTTLTTESNDNEIKDTEEYTTKHPKTGSTKLPNDNKSTRNKKKLKTMEENNETLDSNEIAESSVFPSARDQVTIQ